MARILICDPSEDIRLLLAEMVGRLGHEPLEWRGGHDVPEADAIVLEPADRASYALARSAARRVPIVCASIHAPSRERNGLVPSAYLVKPFSLSELAAALAAALGGAASFG